VEKFEEKNLQKLNVEFFAFFDDFFRVSQLGWPLRTTGKSEDRNILDSYMVH
jgi:hypothetical protein